mmetsp:Transcript_133939/g.199196  ORF Transcript_133939/g.199196 Transcript_133939/m.199196 type:complete len:218 (-) Transcript_133939:35-688(-)|eukprot:CAMPEP_0117039112 /NCGR_PEP_ID=MMETSP0472-20121206/27484_1 /TAXON_ID=693140 ORGANISM="Tiarina fusus, Strain LIS" /NCGR_SAMPLE_ID=MMETSP0472 /ASSEMBLY_ACC=CAM_ASM_000603 /LENGTH=217 /DNA_ID=CAMNT_0004749539 /DNA_START=14 /DNA_END=667 /DNA_ORIENTATION=+
MQEVGQRWAWGALLLVAATAVTIGLVFSDAHQHVSEDVGLWGCVHCDVKRNGDEKLFLHNMANRFKSRQSLITQAQGSGGLMSLKDKAYVAGLKASLAARSGAIKRHQQNILGIPSHRKTTTSLSVPSPPLMTAEDKQYVAGLKSQIARRTSQLTAFDAGLTPHEQKLTSSWKEQTKRRAGTLGSPVLVSPDESAKLAAIKARIAKRAKWIKANSPI